MKKLFVLILTIASFAQDWNDDCVYTPFISVIPSYVDEGEIFKVAVSDLPENYKMGLITCQQPCLNNFTEIFEAEDDSGVVVMKADYVNSDIVGRTYIWIEDLDCGMLYYLKVEIPIYNIQYDQKGRK